MATDAAIRKDITDLARSAGQKAVLALDGGLQALREVGGEAARLAEEFAASLARVGADAAAGFVSHEAAGVALERTLLAIDEVREGVAEAGVKQAIQRARELLSIARDAAIGFAGIAARAAIASL